MKEKNPVATLNKKELRIGLRKSALRKKKIKVKKLKLRKVEYNG